LLLKAHHSLGAVDLADGTSMPIGWRSFGSHSATSWTVKTGIFIFPRIVLIELFPLFFPISSNPRTDSPVRGRLL